jgi:hypothetical protein
MAKRWFTIGSLVVLAATVTACGTSADSTATSTSFSDDARPEDPGAAEVIRELGLDALPGLAPSAVARVQRERRDQRWYRPAATQPVAGHSHDDAASQAAIDGMDATTRAMLDQQLARARRAALRYPTYADARAAGYRAVGPPAPGLGVHAAQMKYIAAADFHFDYPGILMYRDTKPDAPVVGMLYLTRARKAPEGFVGTADQWHEHIKVCIKGTGDDIEILSVDAGEFAPRRCREQGGVFFGQSGWMIHVWPVPGSVPPEGPFSDDNSTVVPQT